MNLVLEFSQIEIKNIHFLDTKKNIIIDGNFTKLVYFDTNVTINGIYVLCPIEIINIDKSVNKHNVSFQTSTEDNIKNIQQITEFEKKILDYYKFEYGIQKNASRTLWNQLNTGKIKLYKENNGFSKEQGPCKIVLKISGIWETNSDYGITYKFLEMY
jgi:hypothetical protein